VSALESLRGAMTVVLAAHITGRPARLTPTQRALVGGYLLPDGRVDPREAPEAADHLRRLGGPRVHTLGW
jgi:8-oxo-dGTP pyrophosphatase MutT (NUDIX family)